MDDWLQARVILTEGAVIERLRRDPHIALDAALLNAALLFDAEGRRHLAGVYREYLAIGCECGLPFLVLAPTWHASAARCAGAGRDAQEVNARAVDFMRALRAECGAAAQHILVGGLLGCAGDAYRPREALAPAAALEYHRPQAAALAATDVDLLLASTLPATCEALGLGRALAETGRPYLLSCVVRADGTWLDGTPLHDAVQRLDAELDPPPRAWLLNCVHPAVCAAALETAAAAWPPITARVIGLQANTSRLSPEELDGRAELDAARPAEFAAEMLDLRRRFGTRILGGCCGTDGRHIRALARALGPA